MQADAIPDWAIYILFTPFVPLAGAIHIALGVLQVAAIIGVLVRRLNLLRKHPAIKLRLFRSVYLPLLLLPNIAVVVWGVVTDPAL